MENFRINKEDILLNIKKDLLKARAETEKNKNNHFVMDNREDDQISHYEVLSKIVDAYKYVYTHCLMSLRSHYIHQDHVFEKVKNSLLQHINNKIKANKSGRFYIIINNELKFDGKYSEYVNYFVNSINSIENTFRKIINELNSFIEGKYEEEERKAVIFGTKEIKEGTEYHINLIMNYLPERLLAEASLGEIHFNLFEHRFNEVLEREEFNFYEQEAVKKSLRSFRKKLLIYNEAADKQEKTEKKVAPEETEEKKEENPLSFIQQIITEHQESKSFKEDCYLFEKVVADYLKDAKETNEKNSKEFKKIEESLSPETFQLFYLSPFNIFTPLSSNQQVDFSLFILPQKAEEQVTNDDMFSLLVEKFNNFGYDSTYSKDEIVVKTPSNKTFNIKINQQQLSFDKDKIDQNFIDEKLFIMAIEVLINSLPIIKISDNFSYVINGEEIEFEVGSNNQKIVINSASPKETNAETLLWFRDLKNYDKAIKIVEGVLTNKSLQYFMASLNDKMINKFGGRWKDDFNLSYTINFSNNENRLVMVYASSRGKEKNNEKIIVGGFLLNVKRLEQIGQLSLKEIIADAAPDNLSIKESLDTHNFIGKFPSVLRWDLFNSLKQVESKKDFTDKVGGFIIDAISNGDEAEERAAKLIAMIRWSFISYFPIEKNADFYLYQNLGNVYAFPLHFEHERITAYRKFLIEELDKNNFSTTNDGIKFQLLLNGKLFLFAAYEPESQKIFLYKGAALTESFSLFLAK